jgi:Protein of unknown function (DUF3011)
MALNLKTLKIALLSVGVGSIAMLVEPILAQTATTRPAPGAVTRPAPKPVTKPVTKPAVRPQTKPTRPPRPPIAGRPDRPTTLPSYPTRPGAERPNRPRPPYRPGGYWGYRYPSGLNGFADTIRCESYGGRFKSCYVRTRGRVVLERRYNGRCRYGNGWGYDGNRIWVDNNCRARFAYGIGGYRPNYRDNDGDKAVAIIGGVAVAAGLIAILSNSGKEKSSQTFPAQSSAAIKADYNLVSSEVRPALRVCVEKAASNIAATGGTSVELSSVTVDSLSDSRYRMDVDIRAQYPDKRRTLSFSCTANATEVDEFDFITD